MNTMPKKQVIYGEANYKNLITRNGYYVDKTGYIRLLEEYTNPVFLRPRRFGKSLWCTTLNYYYDINEKDNFQQLFGQTEIGRDPTPMHNSCMILSLDFSIVDPSGSIEDIKSISFFYLGMLTKYDEQYMLLLTKEPRYKAEYNRFKKKYNSEFEDFKTQVETSGKEDFAVEDDLMDWEFATNALKMIEEKKRILGV